MRSPRGSGAPPVEAVIFDWGGVISRRPPGATRRALERRLGLEPGGLGGFFNGEDWLLHSTGRQLEQDFWSRVCAGFPIVPDASLAATVWEHLFLRPPVRQDVVDIIRSLRGRVRVGLLSNAGTELRTRVGPLLHCFDDVVISAEVCCHKPDPEIFELALHRLSVPAGAALFVDDFTHNVAAARELGMRAHRFHGARPLREWLVAQGALERPAGSHQFLHTRITLPGDTVLLGSMRGAQGGGRIGGPGTGPDH